MSTGSSAAGSWWRSHWPFLLAALMLLASELPKLWAPPDEFMLRYEDDSYYNFQVVRHIVQGDGATFDGTAATNGVHPMVVLSALPFYHLFPEDRWMPLRGYGVLMLALYVGIGWIIWNWGRGQWPTALRWFAVAIWCGSFYYREYGLRACDFLWVLLFVLKAMDNARATDPRSLARQSRWIALAVFCRWDQLALLAAALIHRSRQLGWKPALMLRIALPSLVVIAAQGAVYLYVFGHASPGNGRALQAIASGVSWYREEFGQLNQLLTREQLAQVPDPVPFDEAPVIRDGLRVLPVSLISAADLLLADPWFPEPPGYRLFPRLQEWAALGVVLLAFVALRRRQPDAQCDGLPLIVGAYGTLLMAGHMLAVHAFWAQLRYFYPFLACLPLVLAHWLSTREALQRPTARLAIAALAAVYLMVSHLIPSGAIAYAQPSTNKAIMDWVEANTPPTARIGSFQAGLMAYRMDRQVIDLDGKVNEKSLAAYTAQRMDRFIYDEQVEYIVDWPFLLNYGLLVRSDPRDAIRLEEIRQFKGGFDTTLFKVTWSRPPAPLLHDRSD